MNADKLELAIQEAERFIKIGRLAWDRLLADRYAEEYHSQDVAAALRASMDLTRALAELRKS